MKKESFLFVLKLYLAYLLVFVAFKPIFMLFNAMEGVGFGDCLQVLWHGLPLDLATASYFVVVPFAVTLLSCWVKLPAKGLHVFFLVYYCLTALLISTGLCADCVLYGFWDFKLDATVLNYIGKPKDVLASVSPWLVLAGLLAIVAVAALTVWLLVHTSKRFEHQPTRPDSAGWRALQTLLLVLMGGIIFLCMRGGTGKSTMNVGKVYYSETQFLNHSAINPIFSFFSSALKVQDFADEYQFFDADEEENRYAALQMSATTANQLQDSTASLLTTPRPNVVLVMLEGFCASFIQPLGGEADVTPCFNRLTQEGILFSHCYANSFRTDRGTVSILSGYPAFPDLSVMKMPQKSRFLPSLAKSLRGAGYSTAFLYGGDVNFTNMESYLYASGYQRVEGEKHFPVAARKSHAWGAQDHIVLDTLAQQILRRQQLTNAHAAPFFLTCLTLSSHEPWEVPYHRIAGNAKANAMAYTDSCLGVFVNTLKRSPAWNNLVVIFVADHGIAYHDGMTESNPQRSHIPMLWVGGAVRQPQQTDAYCNQSDLAATLLAAMRLPHSQYAFSRNVLSGTYRYPFAMHTFAGGLAYLDGTGATVYDLTAHKVLTDIPSPSSSRLDHAKIYLQKTIQDFDRLGR